MSSSALLDVAISFVMEDVHESLSHDDESAIQASISQFLTSDISIEICKERLSRYLTSTKSIDRIDAILSVPQEPLPPCANTDESPAFVKKHPKPWSVTEDNRLLCAIHRFGLQAWPDVARFVGNSRTRAQCAQRWCRGLDPRICKDDWSQEDEMKLLNLVMYHGNQGWTYISKEMGNRSDVQCRYHYLQMKRMGKDIIPNFNYPPVTMGANFMPVFAPSMALDAISRSQVAITSLLVKKRGRPLKNPAMMNFASPMLASWTARMLQPNRVSQPWQPPQPKAAAEQQPQNVITSPMKEERTDSLIDWIEEYHDDTEVGSNTGFWD